MYIIRPESLKTSRPRAGGISPLVRARVRNEIFPQRQFHETGFSAVHLPV
jgi:hypothetical protein